MHRFEALKSIHRAGIMVKLKMSKSYSEANNSQRETVIMLAVLVIGTLRSESGKAALRLTIYPGKHNLYISGSGMVKISSV